MVASREAMLMAVPNASTVVDCQSAPKIDPVSTSNFDPLVRRRGAVALTPSELVEVAETARTRIAGRSSGF
jgi:hypothetical protein